MNFVCQCFFFLAAFFLVAIKFLRSDFLPFGRAPDSQLPPGVVGTALSPQDIDDY